MNRDFTDAVIIGASSLYPPLVEHLEGRGAQRWSVRDGEAPGVTMAIVSAAAGVNAAAMDVLPDLRFIANYGVGYAGTDVDEARRRGIAVTNTPDVLDDCVADLAVGLLIDVMRGISATDRYVRAGRWESDGPYPLQQRVTGAKVGILGLGRIGQAIADRLAGFRCEIGYHSRSEKDVAYHYEASAEALARWADVLVVATPGGAATQGLVDADVLTALGPDGFLVNIARGSVVDEPALVDALQSGEIAGAGLDVFADEPRVPQALRDLDTVVLTSHAASATVATRQAMADVVLANLDAFLAGDDLVTPVA